MTAYGDLESTDRDFEEEERVIGIGEDDEDEGDGSAAAQEWSSELVSRPEEVDEEARTKSFYFR